MSSPASEGDDRLLTIEAYEQLPSDDRYRDELVRGRIVREPPPGSEHGLVQVNVAAALLLHARAGDLGMVLVESGYALRPGEATVRGPDVSFIARERIPPQGLPSGYVSFPPDLAVEIVSPSNTAADLQEKIADYLAAGVRQVWVIYPRTRTVAVHLSLSEVRILGADEQLEGGGVLPGFRTPVRKLFEV